MSPYSTTPMEDYLRSLGISKVSSFLGEPEPNDELPPTLLNNIDRCVQTLQKGFVAKKNFLLIVDCDVDGYTSATIFYRYFKNLYPEVNITWQLHEGKEHGLEADKLDDIDDSIDYIIVPDAGSAQLEEQQTLLDRGKTIIIMDHHTIDTVLDHPNLVVVNNQNSEQFNNKALSGAGVVLKVVQHYSDVFLTPGRNDYYDLAALGLVSDMMDMRTLDNNYIVWKGLSRITNPMFTALLQQQAYSIKNINHPTKIDVAFYIAPLINGVIRAGSAEEKEMLFKGFIGEPDAEHIVTEFRGVSRDETFYEYVARIAYNTKNRQNTQKEKCMQYLKERIEQQGLQHNSIIVVITTAADKIPTPQNITGLVAMELMKNYGKPVLVLRPKAENGTTYYRGSGRGTRAEGFDSFLRFMRGSQYCDYAEGHDFAFGASVAADHLQDFIAESNARLKDVDFNTNFVEVDAIFNGNGINAQMLYEFAKYDQIYGNCIPQPRIAIITTTSAANCRVMGANASSVRIQCGPIACVRFKDLDTVAKLQANARNEVVLIGRTQLNEWGDTVTTQLIVDQIDVKPLKSGSLF